MNKAGDVRRRPTPGTRIFRAPGRVNIIGEHTDYNDGFVLPTNTALYTRVSVLRRNDRLIRVYASNLDESFEFDLDTLQGEPPPGWAAYVFGVAAMLEREGIVLAGADLEIAGDIPLGGGLSSSASLELAVANALLGAADASIPAARLAELCQLAEREYAGVHCGIMDQFSVAVNQKGKAMLLDCRSLETRFVTIPASIGLLVTDSGAKHRLPDSGYNDRAGECSQAVEVLAEAGLPVAALRDATHEMLDAARTSLGDVLYRRARHVVTEIRRTLDAVEVIENGDANALGELVDASHASLRDDFEVSCDEIELLVETTGQVPGVHGSRMVGAGFGGCVLSVVDPGNAVQIRAQIREAYGGQTGTIPWTHIVAPAGPAGEADPA